ncbi:tRNA (adenosine(37)-N6)-threonylcarbamoyltransferase complex transferase subunit TsaD [Candidatus Saccharibacteria bacterium TM7i]|nr:tRNA (adenosine(37)-N6)-threonylcarbamoyltransferase complex transferase subunit TsaD [Candidatus Saccharibacteria bacterium TM7i]
MRILGIESSCDETAAAIVENGTHLVSNVVRTQIDIHKQYGGVVPEVAARSHIEVINPVIDEALKQANMTWKDIDGIAVTYAPGLSGSLLVGTLTARTIALRQNIPLYPIHHVEAHVYANFITSQADTTQLQLPSTQPKFPMLALIVSGGHSQLVLFKNHGDYELLGQTQDDAVGEAFDKVAKIIGLPYPGGPSIAEAALKGNPNKYTLPKARLQGAYDFSFSGLKTAVLRAVQHEVGVDTSFPSFKLAALLSETQRNDFAASFQKTAVETLVDKAYKAFLDHSPASVVIAGGVAANSELRRQLSERIPLAIEYAPMQLCTDNAAMIASLGYFYAQKAAPADPLALEIQPSLSMTKTAWAK